MTLGWHTVLEFTPSLIGCMIAGGNHSFGMSRNSRECVINLPTTVRLEPFWPTTEVSGCARVHVGHKMAARAVHRPTPQFTRHHSSVEFRCHGPAPVPHCFVSRPPDPEGGRRSWPHCGGLLSSAP